MSNPKYLQSISHLQSFHQSRFEIMTVDQTCLQQFVTLNSCYSLTFKFLRHLAPPTFSLKITKNKKNTLTGPANCKKTTRHHAYLSLCAKSRKIIDEKLRKFPKTSIWAIFNDFKVEYPEIANFSEKYVSSKLKVIFSTNFRPKTRKTVRAVFEKNIKVSDFGLIWRPFREYLQIKNFFQKSRSVTFLPLKSLTPCKKSEKSLHPFLRKLRYQPTNQLLPTTPILWLISDGGPKKIKEKFIGDIFFQPLFLLLQMSIFQTLICNEIINLLMIGEPLVYN